MRCHRTMLNLLVFCNGFGVLEVVVCRRSSHTWRKVRLTNNGGCHQDVGARRTAWTPQNTKKLTDATKTNVMSRVPSVARLCASWAQGLRMDRSFDTDWQADVCRGMPQQHIRAKLVIMHDTNSNRVQSSCWKNTGLCVHCSYWNCKPSYLFRALNTYEGLQSSCCKTNGLCFLFSQ